MSEPRKITPQERAARFNQSTRHNLQMLPAQTASTGAVTLQTVLPKSRLLSKIFLDFTATVNIKHASQTTIPTPVFAVYKLLRRISVDLNNGFSPFTIDGQSLAIYNMDRLNPSIIIPQATNARGMNYQPAFVVSSGGTDNTIHFRVELPISLTPRDPVGLILLQNESTQVTVTADLVNGAEMFNSPAGYTVTISAVKMDICTETFTVPADDSARPDLSVIKLVNARSEALISGQNILKLNCGSMYRKLALYLEKADGTPFADSDVTSNIEIVFNQADIPYSISATQLAHKCESDLGYALPAGVFLFDFANQGIPNLGGSRDYIDTEKLTEFWLRFSTGIAGKATVITETIARLVQ